MIKKGLQAHKNCPDQLQSRLENGYLAQNFGIKDASLPQSTGQTI